MNRGEMARAHTATVTVTSLRDVSEVAFRDEAGTVIDVKIVETLNVIPMVHRILGDTCTLAWPVFTKAGSCIVQRCA